MKLLAWIVANEAQVAIWIAAAAEIGAGIHNALLHQPIDLAAFGTGLAAILAVPPAAHAAVTAAKAYSLKLAEKQK